MPDPAGRDVVICGGSVELWRSSARPLTDLGTLGWELAVLRSVMLLNVPLH